MKTDNEILIVEDTAASLKLLTEILTGAGYEVRPASDGELALRSVASKLPALILLDIRMPGIDGYEVCSRLKADERTKDIPVIFLSSLSDSDDKLKGFKLGAVDFITKPYNSDELLARVKTHVELYRLKNSLEALVDERTHELKESEERLKLAARSGGIGIWDWDIVNNTLKWDDMMFALYGAKREDFSGALEAWESRILKDDLDSSFKASKEALVGVRSYDSEFRVVHPDGSVHNIKASAIVLRDNDGKAVRMIGVNWDITQSILSAKRIAENAAILEKLAEGVYATDQDGTCTYVNSAACQLLGYEPHEILGKNAHRLFHYKHLDGLEYLINDCPLHLSALYGKAYQSEEWFIRKDGSFFPVQIATAPFYQSDILLGAALVFADITDKKAAEEELKQLNQNLEARIKEELAKNREKDAILLKQSRFAALSEMLSYISHQWRQPLNVIAVAVQDVKNALEDNELDAEYVEKMESDCLKEVFYLSRTIDDFRRFFQPDVAKERFLISEILKDTVSMIYAELIAKGIVVQANLDEDILLYGFKKEFSHAIFNIISNAKDALNGSKQPHKQIAISAKKVDSLATITIQNNGPKIDEAIIGKIFDPYFTTKFQSRGTGLGLYMTKMIIEQNMDGAIKVANIDDGVCFMVELPVA